LTDTTERERRIPLIYRGATVDAGFRVDLIVENSVLVEVKAVDSVAPVHRAQVITYLKLTGCKLGLLINFNVPLLHSGVHRLLHPDVYRRVRAAPLPRNETPTRSPDSAPSTSG
jgi:GxxExxY protein